MGRRRKVLFWLVFGFILGWAVFVRCWGVGERAFWMDEAWVADAVTNLSFKELLIQTELPIPPLFAVSVKLIGRWVPPPEVGLRLLPLVCGVACVPLAYLTVRTLRLPRITSLVGMALCASSPLLVTWSRELKQYEIEAFFSVLLALLVFRARRCGKGRRWQLGSVGVVLVCLLGPWLGYGSVFAGAVLMFVLILLPPISGSRRRTAITGLAGLGGLAVSIVSVLYVAAASQAGQEALLSFTKPWFIEVSSWWSWARAGAYGLSGSIKMIFPFYGWATYLHLVGIIGGGIWLLALLGLWSWPRKSRLEMTCWVIGPWVLLVAAAAARKYPLGTQRMMLFLAVPFILAVGMGLVSVCRLWCNLLMGRGGVGIVLALGLALLPVFYMFGVPIEHKYYVNHDFPTVLGVLEQQRKVGELVYVALDAVPPVRYYARNHKEDFIFPPNSAGTLPVPGYDYNKFIRDMLERSGGRFWLLTTSFPLADSRRQKVLQVARWQGYEFELVAEAGGEKIYGVAQLYSARKKGKRRTK